MAVSPPGCGLGVLLDVTLPHALTQRLSSGPSLLSLRPAWSWREPGIPAPQGPAQPPEMPRRPASRTPGQRGHRSHGAALPARRLTVLVPRPRRGLSRQRAHPQPPGGGRAQRGWRSARGRTACPPQSRAGPWVCLAAQLSPSTATSSVRRNPPLSSSKGGPLPDLVPLGRQPDATSEERFSQQARRDARAEATSRLPPGSAGLHWAPRSRSLGLSDCDGAAGNASGAAVGPGVLGSWLVSGVLGSWPVSACAVMLLCNKPLPPSSHQLLRPQRPVPAARWPVSHPQHHLHAASTAPIPASAPHGTGRPAAWGAPESSRTIHGEANRKRGRDGLRRELQLPGRGWGVT